MKTAGIIAEFNPFHNGHRYLIDEIRRQTGADYVIAAMSGDFVQRGEPAVYDKYARTAIALNSGADLVLELPALFATSSAEDFAACGVALLDRLGVVDVLGFGSECGQIGPLKELAGILADEPESYQTVLRELLRQGETYPLARCHALSQYLTARDEHTGAADPCEALLASPNNILGIEYSKALIRRDSGMEPFTVKRSGHGYHDTGISADGMFSSASGIRQILQKEVQGKDLSALFSPHSDFLRQMPKAAGTVLKDAVPVFADDLSRIMNYRLLELCERDADLTQYADVSPELAERIKNQALGFCSFTKRVETLKTRQYTYTRVSRALLHILLGITADMVADAKKQDYVSCARVLGFRRDAQPLLGAIKRNASLPLLTKVADAGQILTPDALTLFDRDLHSSHLYQSIQQDKGGALPPNEYTHPVILV